MRYLKEVIQNLFLCLFQVVFIILLLLSNNFNYSSTSKLIQDYLVEIRKNKFAITENKTILEQVKDLNFTGDLTKDEATEIADLLNNQQESLKNKHSELKSKIVELLDKEK